MSINHKESQNRQPSKVISHHLDWSSNMQLKMGVESGFENFSHEYQKMRVFMDDLELNIQAQKQNVLGGKTKFGKKISKIEYNPETLKRIKSIWYGTTYLKNIRDPRDRVHVVDSYFMYDRNAVKIIYGDDNEFIDSDGNEWIKLPPLRDMCPIGRIDDMTWGLRLDIPVLAKYAFEGFSFDEIILQGKFFSKFSDGTKPRFRNMNELRQSNVMVSYVGRIWWKKVVTLLEKFWNQQYYELFVTQHRMIQAEKQGSFSSEGKRYVPDATLVE